MNCAHEFVTEGCATGYATLPDGSKVCYGCAAERDRLTMIEKGHSRNLPLYLIEQNTVVSNWPNTLRFKLFPRMAESRHNIGGKRLDFWFVGPDGHVWHGYQIGEYNQIAHCKRTQEVWKY